MRGHSLIEAMAVLALAAIALSITAAGWASMRRAEVGAAAYRLAVTLHGLRWRAVAQSRAHGLRFVEEADGIAWYTVRDGNGNGLRRVEIESGIDPTLSGPHRLRGRRVRFGFPDVARVPRIPPQRGALPLDDPLRLGASELVSFTPIGRSSTGSIYLTDGDRALFGLVLFGPGTRVRVWRYDVWHGRWRR